MSGSSYITQIMIAEKASDMLREKDTVKPIRDYFKHLAETKHKRYAEGDDEVKGATIDAVDDEEKHKRR